MDISCLLPIDQDGLVGREKGRVEPVRRRHEQPIERVGERRTRNIARVDRDGSREFREPSPRGIKRVVNPPFRRLRQPQPPRGVTTSMATALFQTRLRFASFNRTPYAVAPDGRFLMTMSVGDAGVSPITLLLNWSGLR